MKAIKAVVGLSAVAAALMLTPNASANDVFFLDKQKYEVGDTITISMRKNARCEPVVRSAGFAAPIALTGEEGERLVGGGKATSKAGSAPYEAVLMCGSVKLSRPFTVVTKAKAPVTKPNTPIVQPKGAPQTGGGGTSR